MASVAAKLPRELQNEIAAENASAAAALARDFLSADSAA
jgi:hypothetical protein